MKENLNSLLFEYEKGMLSEWNQYKLIDVLINRVVELKNEYERLIKAEKVIEAAGKLFMCGSYAEADAKKPELITKYVSALAEYENEKKK